MVFKDNPVTVTLSSNTSITANFALIPVYTLSVSAEEGGSVSSEGGDYQEGNPGYYNSHTR